MRLERAICGLFSDLSRDTRPYNSHATSRNGQELVHTTSSSKKDCRLGMLGGQNDRHPLERIEGRNGTRTPYRHR
jgi:hypothetical protein